MNASAAPSGLAALLQFEADLRRQASLPELAYFIANETRRLVPYEQLCILRRPWIGSGFMVETASGIAVVDRNAPLIRALERTIGEPQMARRFVIGSQSGADAEVFADYPFDSALWQPLFETGNESGTADTVFAGLLLLRSSPFDDGEATRIGRIAETAAHAWRALAGGRARQRRPRLQGWQKLAAAAVAVAVALLPIRMSTLAPVEVAADRPHVITAPFPGVITALDVAPNTTVALGQTLVRFEDVKLKNELALAAGRLQVARTRVEQASNTVLGAPEEARDILIARAEYELARAEHDYARDLLARARIAAPRDGLAIYADRREWEGRAVDVGQAIMQVADPTTVVFRIDLPAHAQMALAAGGPVRIWLDSQPFQSIDATLERISYQARQTPEGVLAFLLTARSDQALPRIGSRGTARVYGERVPLLYYLLKRPISALRQAIGL